MRTRLFILLLLLVLTSGSFYFMPFTFASYSNEYNGSDSTLIAKWNFRVGANEDNLHNEGFTFDVFNGQQLSPQDRGENSFLLTGGESDVAIDYQVLMNVQALQADINGVLGGEDYPPLIFYVSSVEATVHSPYDSWFDLKDINTDSEGYFQVASGQLAAGSNQLVDINVNWWWNTSFYVGSPNSDTSPSGNYYAQALSAYESLVNVHNTNATTANDFFDQHVRTVITEDGVDTVSYDCAQGASCPYATEGGDIDAAHMAAYDELVEAVEDVQVAINNCLKSQYDNYDTKAVTTLKSLESAASQGILIKVVATQKEPAPNDQG